MTPLTLKKLLVTIISFLITSALLLYVDNRQHKALALADRCAEQWNVEEEGLTKRNMGGYYHCLGDDREFTLNQRGLK